MNKAKSGLSTPSPRTVVITGASAGIGRAVARGFGGRGDRVGLVARGKAGLEAARKEIEELGGEALVVPTDVADFTQVEEAARLVEEVYGPIDVWVNVAFTSVFAPFWQIEPDEFARVTQVSYLGYVNATRVALDRMRPRDHGTIVQVGFRPQRAQHPPPVRLLRGKARHQWLYVVVALRTDA